MVANRPAGGRLISGLGHKGEVDARSETRTALGQRTETSTRMPEIVNENSTVVGVAANGAIAI